MRKKIILFFVILLMFGAIAGYIFLTREINAGSLKIAEGEKQLAQGEEMLSQGKSRLASGQHQLSIAKSTYKKSQALPVMLAGALPILGEAVVAVGDKMASDKISEGQRQVLRGEAKIKLGEEQLAVGKLQLISGMQRLEQAKKMRLGCAIAAVFFGFLAVILWVVEWRKEKVLKSY